MSDSFNVIKIFGEHLVNPSVLKKYPVVINAGVHQGQEMYDLMDITSDVQIYAIEPSRACYNIVFNTFESYKNIKFINKALVGSNRTGTVQFTDFLSNGKYYDYGGLQELSEFRSSGETYDVDIINMKELLEDMDSDIGYYKEIASKVKQIALEIQDIPSKSYSECKNDIINKLESLDYSVYTHQDGDITNDKESSEIINGQEFKTGGLYAIKKEEIK